MDLKTTRYFLMQMNKYGAEGVLKRRPFYHHYGWEETPRDRDHGKVNVGDVLVVYFTASTIFRSQIKKIYQVQKVVHNNSKFFLSEEKELNGISFKKLRIFVRKGN